MASWCICTQNLLHKQQWTVMLQTQAHMQMKMQNATEEQMKYGIYAHYRTCSI
jgi:hypothetical protein